MNQNNVAIIKCRHCFREFKNNINLEHHYATAHIICELCSKTFSRSSHLISHVKTIHKGQKDYKCDNCEKQYSSPQGLHLHIESFHGGKRDKECNVCKKSFYVQSELDKHIQKAHNKNEEVLEKFHAWIVKTNLSANTAKNYRNHIRSFTNFFNCDLSKLISDSDDKIHNLLPDCTKWIHR